MNSKKTPKSHFQSLMFMPCPGLKKWLLMPSQPLIYHTVISSNKPSQPLSREQRSSTLIIELHFSHHPPISTHTQTHALVQRDRSPLIPRRQNAISCTTLPGVSKIQPRKNTCLTSSAIL